MSGWGFRAGMRVACLEAPWRDSCRQLRFDAPVKGGVYTIRAVLDPPGFGQQALHLAEIRNPAWSLTGREIGFAACYFGPLDERRLDQFRAHLAPRATEAA